MKIMKKFLIGLLISHLSLPAVLADDEGNMWDLYNDDPGAYNQKNVSEAEFQKALESKTGKKKKKKGMPKGDMYRGSSDETKFINNVPVDLPVIPVPLNLYAGSSVLPSGHYQVKGELVNGKPVLKFYQAHYMIAQLNAIENRDDFGQDNINFVKLVEHSDNQVKLIFGSMEFNAYAIMNVAE